jgi:L-alanine-DL-glutamate epimerase-like enolase superfamily enzyme
VKVVEVAVRTVEVDAPPRTWHRSLPEERPRLSFVRVRTDDGAEGSASTWLPGPRHELVDAVEQFVAPLLVGRHPGDRAQLWGELAHLGYFFPLRAAASAVDVALWDLQARVAGVPVHRLLGTVHDRLPCYASVPACDSAEAAADLARACVAQGFRGFKLHSRGVADDDIEACHAVREAIGPGVALMLDPVNAYDRVAAVRVARAIEPLDLAWLEAPLPDDDVAGYVELRARTAVPICNGEVRLRGLHDYADLLTRGAVDVVRYAADVQGGLTGYQKVAALCEAHGRRVEGRAYGSTHVQATHLHGALASPTAGWFEVPVPLDWMGFAATGGPVPGPDGWIEAPTAPGLGVVVDWDAVDAATVLRA